MQVQLERHQVRGRASCFGLTAPLHWQSRILSLQRFPHDAWISGTNMMRRGGPRAAGTTLNTTQDNPALGKKQIPALEVCLPMSKSQRSCVNEELYGEARTNLRSSSLWQHLDDLTRHLLLCCSLSHKFTGCLPGFWSSLFLSLHPWQVMSIHSLFLCFCPMPRRRHSLFLLGLRTSDQLTLGNTIWLQILC